jgi:hypothetical protein
MLTTVPSTGPPSTNHGFIRIAAASFTAPSEKPMPAGSPDSAVEAVREPSAGIAASSEPSL